MANSAALLRSTTTPAQPGLLSRALVLAGRLKLRGFAVGLPQRTGGHKPFHRPPTDNRLTGLPKLPEPAQTRRTWPATISALSTYPSGPSDLLHTCGIRGGSGLGQGAMMVVRCADTCGTNDVSRTGSRRDLAAQDDLGVGLSLPDGVGRDRRRSGRNVVEPDPLLRRVGNPAGSLPRRRSRRLGRWPGNRKGFSGHRAAPLQPARNVRRPGERASRSAVSRTASSSPVPRR